jgi:hypothetical protein
VSATNASPSEYQSPADTSGKPVPVFVINAVRTSDDPGPGVKMLPPAEAGALVAARIAVHGDQPPTGWSGS